MEEISGHHIGKYDNLPNMLVDCSIDRLMAIDNNWNIIAWNKRSELISGIPKSAILGTHLLEAFPQLQQDDEMIKAIENALKGYHTFLPADLVSFNRTNSENHFIPLVDRHDKIIGVVNIVHDITNRLKTEKRLNKLHSELKKKYQQLEEANRDLATIAYITSQDIKVPLKLVYTSIELLIQTEAQALSNRSKGNLRRIQVSLNKMNLLLDDIFNFSGINTKREKLQLVDLNLILKESLDILKPKIVENNALVKFESLTSVKGYPILLRQLFINLIDNAIKFHEDHINPIVSITCHKVDEEEVKSQSLSPDYNYIKIAFADNGFGFREEDHERIYKMFERLNDRKYHGSGIGLTICRKVADVHDGLIRATSSPGTGSTFFFYLPTNIRESSVVSRE